MSAGTKIIYRTYRYAAKATARQHRWLYLIFKSCAELYDLLRSEQQQQYRTWKKTDGDPKTKPVISRNTFSARITKLRKSDPFWNDVAVQVARGVAFRLLDAYERFFAGFGDSKRKVGFPRAKNGRWRSISIRDTHKGMVKLDPAGAPRRGGHGARLSIKGIPNLRFRPDKRLRHALMADPDCVKEIRIVRNALRLEVQLVVAIEVRDGGKRQPPENPLGIDMGVSARLTTSEGEKVPPVERDHKRGKRIQRKIARSAPAPGNKSSNGHRKHKRTYAKHMARETERIRNETHRLTTMLVRNHDGIAVENIAIGNLTRKGRGKRGLNRRIMEQSWGTVRYQLEYKAGNADCWVVRVNPAYTSRDCSGCGNRKGRLPLSVRTYRCDGCGLVMERDHNAAVNVCDRALRGEWAVPGGNFPGATRTTPKGVAPVGATGRKPGDNSLHVNSSDGIDVEETVTLVSASSSPDVAVQCTVTMSPLVASSI